MVRSTLVIMCVLLLAACAGQSLKHQVIRHEPSFAKPPAQEGLLSDMAGGVIREHGADASGFRLLDRSDDSLAARLALINSAVSSLDIQTYLWYPDNFGKLMLQHAIKAADRGVYTRLIVIDREQVFIGSMNFDPRSANINTEAGAVVHSPGLAEELARVMEQIFKIVPKEQY